MTTNSSSTRFRNSSVRSTTAIPRTSAWWLTQTMPIMKKLIRYATKTGQWVPSWWSSVSWRPGLATMRLRASSVMATAKTPSLNASSLDLSTCALVSVGRGPRLDGGEDLVHAVLDFVLLARHVLAGEVVQQRQHLVLAVQDLNLLLAHLVQRDERLMVGDGPAGAGGLGPVRADLQRDHDRQLRQVEDGQQQRPGRIVEPDDVAEEEPGHHADGDEDEDVHGAAEGV